MFPHKNSPGMFEGIDRPVGQKITKSLCTELGEEVCRIGLSGKGRHPKIHISSDEKFQKLGSSLPSCFVSIQ
jgi:hypothetical protein